MSNIVEAKNKINDKGGAGFLNIPNKFDIGITMLRNQREKITNGGKYNERYQNTFAEKKGYPFSVRYKDINGRLRQTLLNSEGSSSDSSSVTSSGDKSKLTPSPISSPKFDKPVKLTTILNGSPTKYRNATQDLNKTSDVAQLTSFKLLSDKLSLEKNQINRAEQQPLDTINILEQAEIAISNIEANEIRKRNMEKFNQLCKNVRPEVKKGQKDVSQELREEPRKAVNIESLAPPLKSFNEVENFLKPGVSDMEAENTENFERRTKIRSSTGRNERQEKNSKSKPLSRAASDAQDHKIPDRTAVKPKPRNRIELYSKEVFFVVCTYELFVLLFLII